METRNQLKVPKWPFMVADVILIVCAALVYVFGGDELGPGGGALIVLFLFLGAVAILIPFVVEFLWQWQLEVAAREEVQQQRLLQVEMKAREPMAALLERLESAISAMPEGGSGERIEEVFRELAAQKDSLQKIAGEFEKIREKGESEQPEVVAAYSLISRLETVAEKFEEMLSAADGKVEMEEESPSPASIPDEEISDISPGAAAEVSQIEENSDADNGGMMVLEETPVRSVRRRKPRVKEEAEGALFSTATVVATAFIGAGNKLFLRGDGPGLNWEEGVPMNFVEIGKWSWTTAEAKGPVQLQIFKNDEEADKAGVLTLEPGQTLSVRPDFEG